MIIEPHTHQYNWSWARIDVYLSQYCGMSRNFVQHCINHWLITISDQAIKKSYHLQDGDLICIWSLARFQDVGVLAECAWIPLEIKLQTPDYVVLIKPKWVLSHPTSIREVGQPSVVWFLAHHFSNIPSVGSIIRAGLIQNDWWFDDLYFVREMIEVFWSTISWKISSILNCRKRASQTSQILSC